jgi:hypothetical protein
MICHVDTIKPRRAGLIGSNGAQFRGTFSALTCLS